MNESLEKNELPIYDKSRLTVIYLETCFYAPNKQSAIDHFQVEFIALLCGDFNRCSPGVRSRRATEHFVYLYR